MSFRGNISGECSPLANEIVPGLEVSGNISRMAERVNASIPLAYIIDNSFFSVFHKNH